MCKRGNSLAYVRTSTYLRNEMERDTPQMMVVVACVGTYSHIWYGINS